MGIFSSIKNAIWGSDKDETKAKPAAPAAAPVAPAAPAAPAPAPAPTASSSAPDPISQEEMETRIGNIPDSHKYNWKTSIVDLMKMVGIDPSYENRKELAHELGMTDYEGTAEQNINLHHAVINMLAAEGGAMPDMLRD